MEKYILTEDDARSLSSEDYYIYSKFISTVRFSGIVYQKPLEDYEMILKKGNDLGILGVYGSVNDDFYKVLAANLDVVVNMIADYRNLVINGHGQYNEYSFELIRAGLDILKRNIDGKLATNMQGGRVGAGELEDLLSKIAELRDQIQKDMLFFQTYDNQKVSARVEYFQKKEIYDKLSLFGKLVARLSGQKADLDSARQKYVYYESGKIPTGEPGLINNPYQYDDFLNSQVQKNEGMGR